MTAAEWFENRTPAQKKALFKKYFGLNKMDLTKIEELFELANAKEKKKNSTRHSGMKIKPYANPANKKKKKYRVGGYGPFTFKGRLKPGLSNYQKKTMNEFMKVREGETIEQWRKRTARRRVKDEDEIKEMALMSKVRVYARKNEKKAIESKNRFVKVEPHIKDFDFLRYFGIVINFYSIKYGIQVDDLLIGFYFYSNIPFTKDRFDNAAVLHYGRSDKKLFQMMKKGYVEEIILTKKRYKSTDIEEKTYLYKLTKVFVDRLTYIYRTMAKMNGIRIPQPVLTPLPPEVKKIIMDMNDEVLDIQTGRKPQDKIKQI